MEVSVAGTGITYRQQDPYVLKKIQGDMTNQKLSQPLWKVMKVFKRHLLDLTYEPIAKNERREM